MREAYHSQEDDPGARTSKVKKAEIGLARGEFFIWSEGVLYFRERMEGSFVRVDGS